ncbi:MAG: uracil-DNA glycosylase [Candidatus Algichlamydia australiensis]|nr:uracil-DNA glycosylase [Chlamydiales bacterium]
MKLTKNWFEKLGDEIQKPYIQKLKKLLEVERAQGTVYPEEKDVFSAFGYTPFDKVKVVIMGQDPYHGPNQAHGLCFSVQPGVDVPPSLKNIYKELESDLGIKPPNHGYLVDWAKQGVLLLNATLTVRAHQAKSHYGIGWEQFTDSVIEKLCQRADPIVFVLWGRSAKEKCEKIVSQSQHAIISSPHPSPLSAHAGFFGSKPFSKVNNHLINWGKEPINWSL